MEWQQSMTSLMPQGILIRNLFDDSNQNFQFSNAKQSQNKKQITNHKQKNQMQSGKVDHLTKSCKTSKNYTIKIEKRGGGNLKNLFK